jgi:hypothetical protein
MRALTAVRLGSILVVMLLGGTAAGAPRSAPSPATLLLRHAPVVVLHPDEQFAPVPVDGFLADSDVKLQQPDGTWQVVSGPLPTSGGPWRLDQRLCDVRAGLEGASCYAAAEAAHDAVPTVYGATFRRGKRIALQYWLFYPFNGYSPEVPPNPDFAQLHEGDWELVEVVTDLSGRPLTAAYSRHCAGGRRAWAKVEKRGSHPVVYVALGSHANYFAGGKHALDPRCWPKEAVIVFETYKRPLRDFTAAGLSLRPKVVTVKASTPSWMAFPGTWGEDQIIDFPEARFTYKAGPEGPAFHDAWKNPLAPMSWPKS